MKYNLFAYLHFSSFALHAARTSLLVCFPRYCLHDLGLRSTLICDRSESWALVSDAVRDCQTLSVAWLPASYTNANARRHGSRVRNGQGHSLNYVSHDSRLAEFIPYRPYRKTEALGHVLGAWRRCTMSCQLFRISTMHNTTTMHVTILPAQHLSLAQATVGRERNWF